MASGNIPLSRTVTFLQNQQGITVVETAIVLIRFVVVAALFAFAVLNTGLLSSEKSKQATLGGLEETSATLNIRGQVIADAKIAINALKFTLTPAYAASETVNLSTTGSVLTYVDDFQGIKGINCENLQIFGGDADTAECS